MRTKVRVHVDRFEGEFDCTIQSAELSGFVDTLRELKNSIGSESKACWSNMECNIEYTFKLSKLGALEGAYRFSSNNFSLGPTLSGEFEADQSYISVWLKQAEEALSDARS